VRRLIKEEQQDRVNDLVLEEYAQQLDSQMKQRKRATLETIRAELQNAYEELRHNFAHLSSDQVFTQLTGETRESLQEGMIVPVSVNRTFGDHIEVKLDCGIIGTVAETEYPEDVYRDQREARSVWTLHQTVRGKLKFLNRKGFEAELTFRDVELRKPFKRHLLDHDLEEWDDELEARDKKEARKAVDPASGRAQRVIKHPLFRPFNGAQAVEFLGPLARGDCVIRPSSKGPDHLAVTWKVHEGVFQHIDVLELDKENEFSVGRTLRIGGGGAGKGWTYSDLDELIVLHVRAMARKVEEMMGDERFQAGSRQQTGKSTSLSHPSRRSNHILTYTFHRTMAHDLYRSQSPTQHVRLLPQPEVPGLLLPVLQSRAERSPRQLASEGHPECFRVEREQVSGYAGAQERLQGRFPKYGAWSWCGGQCGEEVGR